MTSDAFRDANCRICLVDHLFYFAHTCVDRMCPPGTDSRMAVPTGSEHTHNAPRKEQIDEVSTEDMLSGITDNSMRRNMKGWCAPSRRRSLPRRRPRIC